MAKVILHPQLEGAMIIPPDVVEGLRRLTNAATNSIKRKNRLKAKFHGEGLTDSEAFEMAWEQNRVDRCLLEVMLAVIEHLPE